MRQPRRLVLLLGLGACASVDPEPALEAVREMSAERGDAEVVWVRSEEDQQAVSDAVAELMADGLTRDEAARVAVLNDPALQARLAWLGIAASDVTQASLPRNPTVDFYWAFPADSGNTALGITGWLADLWMIPRRKRVAEMDALIVQYEVALDVMRTAIGAAAAWDGLVAARQELELARAVEVALANIAARRGIRFAHGLDDVQMRQAAVAIHNEQLAVVQNAEQRVTSAENELERRLAVQGVAAQVASGTSIEAYAAQPLTLQQVLDVGMLERLDLAVAQSAVERQARQLGLEKVMAWNAVALGVGTDGRFRDLVGDEASLGPIVSIDVPIFDRNQAGKARARYEIQEAEAMLRAVQWEAATDLDRSFRGWERAARALELMEGSALPAAQEAWQYTREWSGKMQLAYLDVQQAELELLGTRMAVVSARLQLNDAWRNLQMALRGASR